MIRKLGFSMIAAVMLVLLGFGFQNQAKAGIADLPLELLESGGPICPGKLQTTGFLQTSLFPISIGESFFHAGLIGTVEASGLDLVAGLDWMHANGLDPGMDVEGEGFIPTNATGSQIISWWTQKDGRNTYLQLTNAVQAFDEDALGNPLPINVHVVILGENCLELANFCDSYTGWDTHEYDFGNLITNDGVPKGTGNLQGREGFVVATVTKNCFDLNEEEQVVDHNFLAGQVVIHDSDDYLYGANTYARRASHDQCTDETGDCPLGDTDSEHCRPIGGWCLDGEDGCRLNDVNPTSVIGQFNVLPQNAMAGADVVYINFSDLYPSPLTGDYQIIPAAGIVSTVIFDEVEVGDSCGPKLVCFARFGINDNIVPSEEIVPPTLPPTTAPPTTTAPTTTPPTTAPPTNNNNSNSCAIAGNPVQLGTALANVLIPLVPVAFAFGVRAVRRRKK